MHCQAAILLVFGRGGRHGAYHTIDDQPVAFGKTALAGAPQRLGIEIDVLRQQLAAAFFAHGRTHIIARLDGGKGGSFRSHIACVRQHLDGEGLGGIVWGSRARCRPL